MIMLNLQEQKLRVVEDFLSITDPQMVSEIDLFIKELKNKSYQQNFSPMTLDEFYTMIDKSESDISQGKYSTTDQLLKEIELWN